MLQCHVNAGVICGYFDDDHHYDIFVNNEIGANELLFGDGTGGFLSTQIHSINPEGVPLRAAGGDFNQDGIVDIVVANTINQPNELLLGN